MAKVAACDKAVGWTMERSYAPTGPANDDDGDDDDSPVDNEEVLTEKPQTTWPGRGLAFFPWRSNSRGY